MPITHGFRGFIRIKMLFFHYMCAYKLSSCSKTYFSGIHSLHHFKNKKPIKPTKKKIGRSTKDRGKRVDKEPKVYMRNTIENISKILRFSTWDSARERLESLPIKWDSYTINQVLKTHPPMEKAWLFFNWASHLGGFKHDQFTYTTMLDIFGEAGRIPSMKFIFQQMQEKGIKIDAVTYTSLMHWLSKDGDVDGSFKMWEEMKAMGFRPTVVSYTAFMKVLFDNNRPKEAAEVYKEMLESRCSPNCYTYTVLIEHLAGVGKFKGALEIFDKMQEAGIQPDKPLCNIFIQKCSAAGEMSAMAQILQHMKENSLVLRYPIYLEALHALKAAGESDHLLREVNPHLAFEGIDEEKSETVVTTANFHYQIDRGIVLNLLGRRNFVATENMLAGMISRKTRLDSDLISDVIRANCANSRPSGALMAYEYSIKTGIKLERDAYVALVGLFIRTSSFQKVLEIVECMVRAGITLGVYLVSILIYKLGCAGMPTSAAKIFNSFPNDQNTTTYSALIAAYVQSQDIDKGLEVYTDMKRRGVRPSSGTYRVLIAGLEEAGRANEAEVFRKQMKGIRGDGYTRDVVSIEERLSNLLFDRG
ncbi:pentatricopeptide repeat-containing protein At2g01390 [Magnolia sinica]|uniref:pentatricopeptide repeat-containing protein At2g01390 n=1 Tax=Magnolia sinica TaxID=86752 RepID=UPI0026596761|nr:pentatricopeptide repeat-containing protein At2g01390 [Magnolia sinica]XP_058069141.1 pentatricopeptide repeat-containing protein At2g01390 [Magnolia sinica]